MKLYHVTFMNRLRLIRKDGIYPRRRKTNVGVPPRGAAKEKRGFVFLSDYDSVFQWLRKFRDLVVVDPLRPDLGPDAPVVLRINLEGLEIMTKDKILPHRIEVWDGVKWFPIRQADLEFLEDLGEMALSQNTVVPSLRPLKKAFRVALRFAQSKLKKAPFLYEGVEKTARPGVQEEIRKFRELSMEERSQIPLWAWLLGAGTPPFKMTKVEAAYVEESPYESNCANCRHAYTQHTSGVMICNWMRGEIKPEAWCRVWKSPMDADEYRTYLESYED